MQLRQTAPAAISGNSTGGIDLLPYFTVGALSVLVWDILSELRRDVKLLRSVRGRGLRGAPYVLARFTTLAFGISSTIFQVTPLSITTGCTQTHTAQTTLYALSLSSTYLLVFFRVRSAFQRDGYISLLFGVLWLLLVGAVGSMVYGTSFSVSSNGGLYGNVNDTNSAACMGLEREIVKGYVFIALLGPLLYVSLVYMFQSARFVTHGNEFGHSGSHTGSDSDSEVWREGFMVDGLQEMRLKDLVKVFVKGLLNDGQGHYLFMILVQLVTFIFFLSSGPTQPQPQVQIPSSQSTSATRFILLVPSTVITNIMVCKVYRNTLALEFKRQELGGKTKLKKHQFLKEMERETCRHEVPLQSVYLNVDGKGKSPTQSNSLNHGTQGHGVNARIWMGGPAGASSSSQSVGGIMVTKTVERF